MPIPAELRDSLGEVWAAITQASCDPDAAAGYRDAIQARAVCVGTVGGRPRTYALTYFPSGDADRGRWSLTLHRTEVEDIADGRLAAVALHCCTTPGCRRKFRDAGGLCFDCDYVPHPGYAHLAAGAALPRLKRMGVTGLTAAATRGDVEGVLGPPHDAGGGTRDQSLGYIKPWVKYRRPDGQLRFEFDRRGTVEAVTFLPADWRPGD